MSNRPTKSRQHPLSTANLKRESLPLSPIAVVIRASIVGLGLGLAHSTSFAATITVDSNLDDGTDCTLRGAINSINMGVLQDDCEIVSGSGGLGISDTINFAMPNNTIVLNGAQLLVENDLTINDSAANIVISAERNSRVLFLDSSDVTLNSLTITNGSINGSGGGIYAKAGSTTISNSTVSGNFAYGQGAGIFLSDNSVVSINESDISNNTAYLINGGEIGSAIHATGTSTTVDINESVFSNNGGTGSGGIIFVENSASASISNSNVKNNSSLYFSALSAVKASTGAVIELSDTTISRFRSEYDDAIAVWASGSTTSISVTNSSVADVSSFGEAGSTGILASDGASISLVDSTVSGIDDFNSTYGVRATSNASIDLSNSTISGIESSYFGANGVSADSGASIDIANSTISGTHGSYAAVGIRTSGAGTSITLSNSTVADTYIFSSRNYAINSIFVDDSASISVYNSILAGARNIQDPNDTRPANCDGNVTIDSSSVVSDASCGEQVVVGDPGIGVLADNGGPTFTHALSADSIAINAASNAICPTTDQRGELRNDGACDVGAFELQGVDVNTYYVFPIANGSTVVIPL
ncbi:hypothetical protein N9060_01030 [Arenicella sp.]|nr:hypothetical protein [Arenicella sp.]